MPRRYYRRTRVVRPKKKWASGIKTINYSISPNSEDPAGKIPWTTLVSNSLQTAAPTPTIVKAGNFKVNADINLTLNASTTSTLHLVAFVVFMPEGISPSDNQTFGNLIVAHPEYIMAWKQIDSERVQSTQGITLYNTQRVTFSSRLKRNLNSGDSIVFGVLDQSTQSVGVIRVALTCQYWTCSN